MNLKTRRARLGDLKTLITFALEEAMAAEGLKLNAKTLKKGIQAALDDENIAQYWVLTNDRDEPVGNISTLKEWSNWNAGYYWWIQSLYISPEFRGKGHLAKLLHVVKTEARLRGALDLRLYAHADNARALKAYLGQGFTESKYKILVKKL